MRRLAIRPLLVVLCWVVLVPACTWGVPGQDMDSVRGAKGSIRSQDELVSHVRDGKVLVVDGYRIQGRDLIAFMREHPHVAIQITPAIIEGDSISAQYRPSRWKRSSNGPRGLRRRKRPGWHANARKEGTHSPSSQGTS
jgi:hypothetical protein